MLAPALMLAFQVAGVVLHGAEDRVLHPATLITTASVPGQCDLCAQRWAFVLASGRSGSTSVLEALNSLPGVQLTGENGGALVAAYDAMRRALVGNNGTGAAHEHAPLSEHALLCTLQQFFLGLDPTNSESEGQGIRGFKELVMPSRLMKATHSEHLPDDPDEWFDFMTRLFPCSHIILNYRGNTSAQTESAFYSSETDVTADELSHVNRRFVTWHRRMQQALAGLRPRCAPLHCCTHTCLPAWLVYGPGP